MKLVSLSIEDLFLKDQNLTFLVGAGCSVDPPSLLPAGKPMTEALIKYTCAKSEIQNILKLEGLRFEALVEIIRDNFCFLIDSKQFQMKNVDGHCYFFEAKTKRCRIYNHRPKGCIFYPLVYNINIRKCEFDIDCPNPRLTYNKEDEIISTCNQIRKYIKEELGIKL